MIYVIESGNYFKIGYAKDVSKRMKSYRTHNPDVSLVMHFKGSLADEAALHRQFKKYRYVREWFTKYEGWLMDIRDIEQTPVRLFNVPNSLSGLANDVLLYVVSKLEVYNCKRRMVIRSISFDYNDMARSLRYDIENVAEGFNELLKADVVGYNKLNRSYCISTSILYPTTQHQ